MHMRMSGTGSWTGSLNLIWTFASVPKFVVTLAPGTGKLVPATVGGSVSNTTGMDARAGETLPTASRAKSDNIVVAPCTVETGTWMRLVPTVHAENGPRIENA